MLPRGSLGVVSSPARLMGVICKFMKVVGASIRGVGRFLQTYLLLPPIISLGCWGLVWGLHRAKLCNVPLLHDQPLKGPSSPDFLF